MNVCDVIAIGTFHGENLEEFLLLQLYPVALALTSSVKCVQLHMRNGRSGCHPPWRTNTKLFSL